MTSRFSRIDTNVINTEIVEGLGDLNLLGGVEEGIGKLLALSQRALDDLERVDVAEKVRDGLVGVPDVYGSVYLG